MQCISAIALLLSSLSAALPGPQLEAIQQVGDRERFEVHMTLERREVLVRRATPLRNADEPSPSYVYTAAYHVGGEREVKEVDDAGLPLQYAYVFDVSARRQGEQQSSMFSPGMVLHASMVGSDQQFLTEEGNPLPPLLNWELGRLLPMEMKGVPTDTRVFAPLGLLPEPGRRSGIDVDALAEQFAAHDTRVDPDAAGGETTILGVENGVLRVEGLYWIDELQMPEDFVRGRHSAQVETHVIWDVPLPGHHAPRHTQIETKLRLRRFVPHLGVMSEITQDRRHDITLTPLTGDE